MDVRQLVAARHVVERFGWPGIFRVHYHVRDDPTFPRPVFRAMEGLKGGVHFWYWPDLEEWARVNGERLGPSPVEGPEVQGEAHLVDVDQLVVARRIAELLRWSGSYLVHYYVRSDDTFPRPLFKSMEGLRGGVHVWLWPEVEEWARRKGKLPDGFELDGRSTDLAEPVE